MVLGNSSSSSCDSAFVDQVVVPLDLVVFKTRIMLECCLELRLPLPISNELAFLLKIGCLVPTKVKAKNYQENFEKVRDKLRLERRAKAESNHALIILKGESEHTLASQRNA
ncbi:hypothetical protein ACFX13_013423 [Malus domestica]|uniref:Uncharacterized protein n=1 Tax=Malus domestica TaxID=3750 RepID=A0A498IAX9_MALDO|nr:hypothetical protein DVH24_002229 [Malus domestica]